MRWIYGEDIEYPTLANRILEFNDQTCILYTVSARSGVTHNKEEIHNRMRQNSGPAVTALQGIYMRTATPATKEVDVIVYGRKRKEKLGHTL